MYEYQNDRSNIEHKQYFTEPAKLIVLPFVQQKAYRVHYEIKI